MEKKSKKQSSPDEPTKKEAELQITAKELDDIFARARQAVKPIIAREAANEIVSEDVLNFRMKT